MACIYPDFLGFNARFWVVWGGKSLFKGTDVSAKKVTGCKTFARTVWLCTQSLLSWLQARLRPDPW